MPGRLDCAPPGSGTYPVNSWLTGPESVGMESLSHRHWLGHKRHAVREEEDLRGPAPER
jgi:hypothetical protein